MKHLPVRHYDLADNFISLQFVSHRGGFHLDVTVQPSRVEIVPNSTQLRISSVQHRSCSREALSKCLMQWFSNFKLLKNPLGELITTQFPGSHHKRFGFSGSGRGPRICISKLTSKVYTTSLRTTP